MVDLIFGLVFASLGLALMGAGWVLDALTTHGQRGVGPRV